MATTTTTQHLTTLLRFFVCALLLLSAVSFVFPRSSKIVNFEDIQHLNYKSKGLSGRTVCYGQRRKKIHIQPWVENFDGCIIQKNGVMYLEQPEQKRVTAADLMNRKGSSRIALLIKGGTLGNNIGNCHLAHFVRMVMKYKSINGTIIPYASYDRPPWLKKPCPNEEPCMMYDGRAYYDPYIMTRHLSFFHPEPPIDGDDNVINEFCDELYSSFHKYIISIPMNEEDQHEEENAKTALLRVLTGLNNLIKLNNRQNVPMCYARGEKMLGLSDCALAPILYQIEIAGKHFKKFEIPSSMTSLIGYKEFVYSNAAFQNTSIPHDEVVWGWERARNDTLIAKHKEELVRSGALNVTTTEEEKNDPMAGLFE